MCVALVSNQDPNQVRHSLVIPPATVLDRHQGTLGDAPPLLLQAISKLKLDVVHHLHPI